MMHSMPAKYSNPFIVFGKEDIDKVQWPNDFCSQTEYSTCYNQQTIKSLSTAVQHTSIDAQFFPKEMFTDIK